MVQLEVADRLVAPPNGDAYGALSVFAQRAFKVTRAFVVKRGAFYPQPNVDSALVAFIRRPLPPDPVSADVISSRLTEPGGTMAEADDGTQCWDAFDQLRCCTLERQRTNPGRC